MPSDNSAPATLAETLLREWETSACPTSTPAYQAARPRVLARLTEFSALLLRPDDINIDPNDARATLRRATAFRLGRASASGPTRAARLLPLLTADLIPFSPVTPPPGLRPITALLSLQSHLGHELEMNELTEIVETVQQTILTPAVEMIFGHGISPEIEEAALQVWLLVGYAAAEDTAAPASSTTRTI